MELILLKLLFLFLFIISSFAKDEVKTYGEVKDGELCVYIKNNNPFDITYKYIATYDELYPMQPLPIENSLEANSTAILSKFMILGKQYKLTNSYVWTIGNINSIHNNNYFYRLPYEIGETHLVTQGFRGNFSHSGDSEFAVDFGMDVGTKIYASRGGIVVMTKSDGYKSGPNRNFAEEANHITIKHDDGTYGKYVHLKQNGVAVQVGDIVNRGDFLGYSGNTGFTNGPHLHFVVFKGKDSKSRTSIPIKFITKNGFLINPIVGNRYTAVK